MDKYPLPSFVTAQHVMEDISDPVFLNQPPRKLVLDDNQLQNTYNFYRNFKQLEGDVKKQTELNLSLQALNEELKDSIASLKIQAKKDC